MDRGLSKMTRKSMDEIDEVGQIVGIPLYVMKLSIFVIRRDPCSLQIYVKSSRLYIRLKCLGSNPFFGTDV